MIRNFLIFLSLIIGSAGMAFAGRPAHLWLGADISGTTADEARGVFSTDTAGVVTENTRLMKDYGLDAVRLRVWVNPKDGFSSKEDVLTMAKRAKDLGMEIMIDFHYSDWWADPGKQYPPEAWKDYGLEDMKKALANHTIETLQLLKDNGIDVKWVQVGNETRDGMLWPLGQISKGNFANYAALSQAGYEAVKQVYPDAEVIIHIDNGYDNALYNEIFDTLKKYGAEWDIIGMSVYPYWAMEAGAEPDEDSTIRDAADNIRKLREKYGCDIMITEVGVESEQPEKGERILNDLFDMVINEVDGACTGVFYWAPEMFQTTDAEGNKHGYALGAFQNARPTRIMNSFSRAAEIMAAPSAAEDVETEVVIDQPFESEFVDVTLQEYLGGNSAKTVVWGIKGFLGAELPHANWTVDGNRQRMFNSGFGASLGGIANIYLGKNFYFEPELAIFYESFSYNNVMAVAPNSPSVNVGPNLYEVGIRLPLDFGYFINISDTWGLTVFTGPQLNYAFYGTAKSENEAVKQDANLMNLFKGAYAQRRFDLGWKIGIGFPVNNFMISLEGDLGITNLMKNSLTLRSNRVGLGITYYFVNQ